MIGTWAGMFPAWLFTALLVSLLISALSTLDSALSSAARLVVEELRLGARSLLAGRAAMVGFMAVGTGLTLWGNQTLFDAVAVSGTASMFLTPVLLVGLVMGRDRALVLPRGLRRGDGRGRDLFRAGHRLGCALLPDGHKYEQLLVICARC